MNRFPAPRPISSNGMILRNVRCRRCGKIQWTFGNCKFCHGKVREILERHD